MENHYKSALDKIKLSKSQRDRAKCLFYEANMDYEERRNHMRIKSLFKPMAAVAAGLAIVVAANLAIPVLHNNYGNVSDDASSGANNVLASVAENYFTVTAYAKELTKTGKVYSDDYRSQGYAICSADNDKKGISFAFDFPVECEGENIDTITYAIERGAFQISNPEGQSIVSEGEELERKLNVPGRVAGGIKHEQCTQYKSFTVSYENQTNDKTCIDIVDTSSAWSSERRAAYEKFGYSIIDSSLKKEKEVCDFLVEDMGITCTVKYKDGTTETKNILVSNEIAKLSETVDENIPAEEDEDAVVRYFSIQ